MSSEHLAKILYDGSLIVELLNTGDLGLATTRLDIYLASLGSTFADIEPGVELDADKKKLLEQFKSILALVEQQKSSVEIELLQFSKVGKATKRYKLNVG
ncbi:hypothetical protein NUK42_11970 [Aeromonas veronii]|jgi:hypothetical protein|uniref:hypothetical protein n=1 Tax=Aeromonas TaxID=642 RepID=UPI00191F9C30|nr:hypothetical protein [Aeromonas veronii]MBL0641494.1 hypothetical protein [Aeromonas veronii]MCR3959463.1 hypothetical protein [Aeromonas veronii]